MKIKQAKEYFELGVIMGFCVIRDPLKAGCWLLVIEGKEGRSWTLQTAKNEAKSFASMDTLVGEVEEIAGRVSTLQVRV